MTIHATLTGPVTTDLAEHGITLVVSSGSQTRGDAWADANDTHQGRVAVIHLMGGSWLSGRPQYMDDGDWCKAGAVYVDLPDGDKAAGAAARDVLNAHGFEASWTGDPDDAVVVNLWER